MLSLDLERRNRYRSNRVKLEQNLFIAHSNVRKVTEGWNDIDESKSFISQEMKYAGSVRHASFKSSLIVQAEKSRDIIMNG